MNKTVKNLLISGSALFFTLSMITNAKALDPTEYLESRTINTKKEVVSHDWYDYKRGLFLAEQNKKFAVLNFCTSEDRFCQKIAQSFQDEEVKKLLAEKFVAINIEGTSKFRIESNKAMLEKDLLKKYEIEAYPSLVFLDPKGKQISGLVKGYLAPEKLVVILKYISSDAYKKQLFLLLKNH